MEFIDVIKNRRSIRKYQDKSVPKKLIHEVINAARLAPSGNNTQPWKYKIVDNRETINLLKKEEIIRDQWAYNAPVILVCCTDPNSYRKFVEGWDDPNQDRAKRDLAISTAHLTLMATNLGLGTCYCGWIKKEKIKEILNIPKEYNVPYILTLGYPDENPNPRSRKNIEEIIID